MKIEIELSELESLRRETERYKKECEQLEEKLKSLSEYELKQDAVRLGEKMFSDYMTIVFNKLGFDDWDRSVVTIKDDLQRHLGKSWFMNPDRVDFEIGATVTSKFKRAFIKLGIVPETNEDD